MATYFDCFRINVVLPLDIVKMGNAPHLYGPLFLTLATAYVHCYSMDSTLVLRHHYGIAFQPKETFRPIVDYWLHTFGFSLPPYAIVNRPRKLNCLQVTPENRTHCVRMKPYVDSMAVLQYNMSSRLVSYA